MERYTWIELTDMHLAYSAAFTSGRAAQRLYRYRYPNRRITHNTFSSINRRLCQSGTVHRRADDQGRGVLCEHAEEPCWLYVKNKVPLALKRNFAAHRWRARYNDELYELYKEVDLETHIRCQRLRWLGHIIRMENTRKVKIVFNNTPEGATL